LAVPTRVKRSEYAIAVDRAERLTAEGRGLVDLRYRWVVDGIEVE